MKAPLMQCVCQNLILPKSRLNESTLKVELFYECRDCDLSFKVDNLKSLPRTYTRDQLRKFLQKKAWGEK